MDAVRQKLAESSRNASCANEWPDMRRCSTSRTSPFLDTSSLSAGRLGEAGSTFSLYLFNHPGKRCLNKCQFTGLTR